LTRQVPGLIPVIGAMGLELLDWLAQRTLPEEAKMADPVHARKAAEVLQSEEAWPVLSDLCSNDETFEHELQYDRYGSLMLAPLAFD